MKNLIVYSLIVLMTSGFPLFTAADTLNVTNDNIIPQPLASEESEEYQRLQTEADSLNRLVAGDIWDSPTVLAIIVVGGTYFLLKDSK